MQGFCKAKLHAYIQNGCETVLKLQTFERLFNTVLQEWQCVDLRLGDLHALGVSYGTGAFPLCAACSEGGTPITADSDFYCKAHAERLGLEKAPLHSVIVDGQLGMKHVAGQGSAIDEARAPTIQKYVAPDSPYETPGGTDAENSATHPVSTCSASSPLFVPLSTFEAMHDKGGSSSAAPARDCSQFKAGEKTAGGNPKYDINGVVGILCRHAVIGAVVNMNKGERHVYARYLMFHLLHTMGTPVMFLMYDIGKNSSQLALCFGYVSCKVD